MRWESHFETGLADIDSQHRYFFALIQRVDELRDAASAGELRSVVDEILRYARYHFACEESLMSAYSYPQSAKHHDEHVSLLKRAQAHCSRGPLEAISLAAFLRDWFASHTLGDDRVLAKHVLECRRKAFGASTRTAVSLLSPLGGFI